MPFQISEDSSKIQVQDFKSNLAHFIERKASVAKNPFDLDFPDGNEVSVWGIFGIKDFDTKINSNQSFQNEKYLEGSICWIEQGNKVVSINFELEWKPRIIDITIKQNTSSFSTPDSAEIVRLFCNHMSKVNHSRFVEKKLNLGGGGLPNPFLRASSNPLNNSSIPNYTKELGSKFTQNFIDCACRLRIDYY